MAIKFEGVTYNFNKKKLLDNVNLEIEDNKIKSVNFIGGCPGNLIGISHLVKGMEVEDAINKLKGIPCRTKDTSCPDQLAQALEKYLQQK